MNTRLLKDQKFPTGFVLTAQCILVLNQSRCQYRLKLYSSWMYMETGWPSLVAGTNLICFRRDDEFVALENDAFDVAPEFVPAIALAQLVPEFVIHAVVKG